MAYNSEIVEFAKDVKAHLADMEKMDGGTPLTLTECRVADKRLERIKAKCDEVIEWENALTSF
jgi:hypothetical protein